jgi:steroid delta-isomerase-like uncharacterized protein
MTRDEIVASCRREVESWNAHDAVGVAAFYAEEATVTDAGGETATGREEIAARARQYMDALPNLRFELQSVAADGNRFAMEWRASGTNTGSLAGMPPTNRPVVVEGCDVGEFGDDGLIQRETDYWNEASFLRQLGLMPEAAATA